MPYLTYDEFKLMSDVEVTELEFERLIRKASAVLNNLTSYFYVRNEITKDNAWRISQFKQALVAQIEYFHEVGATTFESINKAPQTFSAGRTSVSNTSKARVDGQSKPKSLVAEEVYMYLEGTGLLFAGVSVW